MLPRALGITLTKRGQHMGLDIPMCGVPIHAADDYLQKLISLGFRVAVCEQVEDPAEAKKRGSKSVVRRDVIRLVTPGTLTEEKLLSPSESNYLMALARIKGGSEPAYAIAWIDISTGVFRLAETARERMLADILRIDPKELILADVLFHDPELRPVMDVLGRTLFRSRRFCLIAPRPKTVLPAISMSARSTVSEPSPAPRLLPLPPPSPMSRRRRSTRVPPLGRPERESSASTLFIDPATRANLELARTLSGSRDGSL